MMRAVIAIALMTAGCATGETVRDYGAGDTLWQLREMDKTPYSAHATLRFDRAGRISGNGPCNGWGSTMTAPYPWFQTGQIRSTKRACPELGAEGAFFAALKAMTLAEVQGNVLILSTPEGREMVFTPASGE